LKNEKTPGNYQAFFRFSKLKKIVNGTTKKHLANAMRFFDFKDEKTPGGR
jgi:hypothetical protein